MSKQTDDAASKKKGQPNDTDPLDNVELVEQVGDKLNNIFGASDDDLEVDDDLEDEDEDLEDEDDDQEDLEEEDDQEEDDDDEEEDESSTLEEDDDNQEEGDIKPVPQAYLQAAKAYGWDEEKVSRLLKLDREAALEALEGIYNTRNQINAHYSNMGRSKAKPKAPKSDAVPKVDTKALRDSMGEEAAPLIDMLEKQNEAINALLAGNQQEEPDDSHLLPDLDRRHRNAVDELGIEQQINSFFESDAMKPFNEVYGNMHLGQSMEDLPPGQRKYRWEVLKKADAIVGGAKMQGRDVSLQEALLDAHLLVSQGFRDKVIVEGIRKKVVKRGKGKTLKPSKGHRKAKATDGKTKDGKRTEQQLMQDTQGRLNKIFR